MASLEIALWSREPRLVVATTLRDLLHTSSSPTSIQQIMITTTTCSARVQKLVWLSAVIDVSGSLAADTNTSVAAVRHTNHVTARDF